MAVLSNNGRLISSLPLASQVFGTDELLIQSNGLTKRLPYSAFTSSILSPTKFNPYGSAVNFSNNNNKFTGSFYSINNKLANFAVVNVRQGITVDGLSTLDTVVGNLFNGNFLGSLSGDVTGNLIGKVNGQFTGSMTGSLTGSVYSTGKSTFNNIDVNGGTIDGTIIGNTVQSLIRGTRISASIGFNGGLTGSIRGDVYTQNGSKVLENGITANPNGNVPSAFFYGTSSYGIQALTAAYALAGGGAAVNGLPTGGTQYQILAKSSATDYATIWTSPITASTPGNNNYLAVWSGAKSLQNLNNFYYAGANWICTTPFSVTNTLTVTGKVTAQSLTGSFYGVLTSPPSDVKITAASTYTINGDLYPSSVLHVSSSGATVTLNLTKGKTCTVLIKNNGAYSISTWNTSINWGASTTSLYWKNGSAPTITSGAGKKDVFTFVNINDYVLGSAVQNFS